MRTGPRSPSEPKGFHHRPAECLESSCLSLRLVEWGFASLNAGAQHWRNMARGLPLSLPLLSERLASGRFALPRGRAAPRQRPVDGGA